MTFMTFRGFEVLVKDLHVNCKIIDIESSESIESVNNKINDTFNVKDDIVLIHKGIRLQHSRSVLDYEINEGTSFIFVVNTLKVKNTINFK